MASVFSSARAAFQKASENITPTRPVRSTSKDSVSSSSLLDEERSHQQATPEVLLHSKVKVKSSQQNTGEIMTSDHASSSGGGGGRFSDRQSSPRPRPSDESPAAGPRRRGGSPPGASTSSSTNGPRGNRGGAGPPPPAADNYYEEGGAPGGGSSAAHSSPIDDDGAPSLSTGECAFNRVYANSKLRQRLETIESIRGDLQAENIEVPGVVVVGNQSAGKSSVLESISGINFPRGENTCTRCASIVRLENDPNIERPYCLISANDPSQSAAQPVYDFSMIGAKIASLTASLGGPESGTILLDEVIYITVKNRSGPTLTLIDLPGLTFVHKTQKNIHDVTVELIKRYIKNEQAVILAVIPATEDFGNCEALNLASEVDPTGARTLGVATKCDIVGGDSDIVSKLKMERASDIKLKLGFVGVRCRSPAEVKNNTSNKDMMVAEQQLFRTHPVFGGKLGKDYFGMDTLVSRICTVQEYTVEKWIPKVKLQIAGMISTLEKEKLK